MRFYSLAIVVIVAQAQHSERNGLHRQDKDNNASNPLHFRSYHPIVNSDTIDEYEVDGYQSNQLLAPTPDELAQLWASAVASDLGQNGGGFPTRQKAMGPAEFERRMKEEEEREEKERAQFEKEFAGMAPSPKGAQAGTEIQMQRMGTIPIEIPPDLATLETKTGPSWIRDAPGVDQVSHKFCEADQLIADWRMRGRPSADRMKDIAEKFPYGAAVGRTIMGADGIRKVAESLSRLEAPREADMQDILLGIPGIYSKVEAGKKWIELSSNLGKNLGKMVGLIPKGEAGTETCYRRATGRWPKKVKTCPAATMDQVGPLCFNKCEQGFSSGPICFMPCPNNTTPCGGLVCTKHGETCSDYFKSITMDGISAAYSGIGHDYLSSVQSVMSLATNIFMPLCAHMYEDAVTNYLMTEADHQEALHDPLTQPSEWDFRTYYKDGKSVEQTWEQEYFHSSFLQ